MSESDVFTPTHVVPDGGLPAWVTPDAASQPVTDLDPGLDVEVVEERPDGWTRAVCANGWSCWVDGGRLRLIPWKPSHRVPSAGLPAWERPDPHATSVASLEGGLGVAVLEQRADGWARVSCENGWSCWVDGRRLATAATLTTGPAAAGGTDRARQQAARPTTGAGVWQPAAGPWALGGAALALLGGFLPWLTGGGQSVSAWKIPVAVLIDKTSTSRDPKIGWLLLLVALVALPYVVRRPVPRRLIVGLGAVATSLAGLTVVYALKFKPAPGIGIGLILTFLGGVAIVFDRKLTARTVRT